MPNNAANRRSVREAERASREADRERGQVLTGVMSTTQGREWLWSRLESTHIFASTYNDSPTRMAYLEGQRTAGLDLLADIMHWCPDLFIQAMREANVRRTLDADRAAAGADDPDSELVGSQEPGRVDQGHPGPEVDGNGQVIYPGDQRTPEVGW